MKRTIKVSAMALVAMVFFALTAQAEIKEGQWAMTMVIGMPGMNEQMAEAQKEMENMSAEEKAMMQQMMGGMGMNMDAGGMTINKKQCVTNDHPVPQQDNQKNCQETHTINGNTVNFEMTCTDSHSSGQVTYENESMTGTIASTQNNNGKEETVNININGQYEGPCVE